MRRRAIALALLVVLLAAVPAGAQTGSIKDLEAQVQAASKRIAEAQARAQQASSVYFEAQSKLDQLADQLERLGGELDELRSRLAALRGDLRDFAVDRYMAGGTGSSPSIFESGDLNEAVARGALADFIGGHKADRIDEVRLAQADIDAKSRDLERQRNEHAKAVAEAAENNSRLAKAVAELQAERDALNRMLAGLLEAERKRLLELARQREEAERARRAAAARTTSGYVAGSWACPIPSGSGFSDTWGQPRSGGRRHLGVDMSAPTGAQVVAMVPGTVTFGRDRLGGLSFYLDGDDGNWYYGTHLSRFGPQSGRVAPGQVIGYVGSTGNASTPHLHLEIHVGGRGNPVNPYPTVARYC
jgi:peptidoglycan LD-endopeptidase LytH